MRRRKELVVEVGAATLIIRLKTFRGAAIPEETTEQLVALLLPREAVTTATGGDSTIDANLEKTKVRPSHHTFAEIPENNSTEQRSEK